MAHSIHATPDLNSGFKSGGNRAAQPGGRVVLQNDDHDVMRSRPGWPDWPELTTLSQAHVDSYRRLGFDPCIGRRLTRLLVAAGVRPTLTTWLYKGACKGQRPFPVLHENLVRVLDGARSRISESKEMTDDVIARVLQRFSQWGQEPDAVTWYAINWAEGVKPHWASDPRRSLLRRPRTPEAPIHPGSYPRGTA